MGQKAVLTREQIDSVRGLSSREAAKKLGCGKTAVNDARARFEAKESHKGGTKPADKPLGKGFKIESKGDSLIVETTDSVPQTKDHIDERMRSRGFDPEKYNFTYGFSEWEAQTPDGIQTLYSARASATERRKTVEEVLTADDLIAAIEAYEPIRGERADVEPSGTFIFCFADPQLGKTDLNGGTEETIQRFLASLDHACAILDEHPAAEIIWADLGDGIENFCNTSSQRQTNDLNLVEQVRVLRRLQVAGLQRFLEYAPVIHVSVPSNHSQNRVGFQSPASTAHDDWGIEVQHQLADVFEGRRLPHELTFVKPEEHLESVSIPALDGTMIGFVHGHRAGQQNSLERWWAGQALGDQPTALAQILLVGHFHNWSLSSVGNQRYIITTPSLDNGSSWWTVSRGNVATAGVLTLRVKDGVPTDQKIV